MLSRCPVQRTVPEGGFFGRLFFSRLAALSSRGGPTLAGVLTIIFFPWRVSFHPVVVFPRGGFSRGRPRGRVVLRAGCSPSTLREGIPFFSRGDFSLWWFSRLLASVVQSQRAGLHLGRVLCRWRGLHHLGGRCYPSLGWSRLVQGDGLVLSGQGALDVSPLVHPGARAGGSSLAVVRTGRARRRAGGAHPRRCTWRMAGGLGLAGLGRGGYRRGVPRNKKVLSGVFQQGSGTAQGSPAQKLKKLGCCLSLARRKMYRI